MKTIAVAAAVGCASAIAFAQTQVRDRPAYASVGSASIAGMVVAADDLRTPIRRATIVLTRSIAEDVRTTGTDENGRFALDRLPAGSYAMSVTKGAYLSSNYGAPKPGMPGSVIVLTEGETFIATPISLTKGAVIAGRVLDRRGQPMPGQIVQVTQVEVAGGERRRRAIPLPRGETNEHGEYRLAPLPPGAYVVFAAPAPFPVRGEPGEAEVAWAKTESGLIPPSAGMFGYAPTMYPGTTDTAAGTVVTLAAGEVKDGVDFALQFLPVARVSGSITMASGEQAIGGVVTCIPRDQDRWIAPLGLPLSRVTPENTFSCPTGLPPGQYVVAGRAAPTSVMQDPAALAAIRAGSAPSLYMLTEVTVNGKDIEGLSLQWQSTVPILGRVVLRDLPPDKQAPDLSRFPLSLRPRSQANPLAVGITAVVAPDGSFRIDGAMPGGYRVATGPIAGSWVMQSAMLGNVDVADIPFEIAAGQRLSDLTVTFTTNLSQLSGTLTDRDGQGASVYVFVYPVDKGMWLPGARRIKSARSSEKGQYSIQGLPAGEYYLCALTEVESSRQFEPDYLEQFVPMSIKITLGEGEKKQQNLQIGR